MASVGFKNEEMCETDAMKGVQTRGDYVDN